MKEPRWFKLILCLLLAALLLAAAGIAEGGDTLALPEFTETV